MSDAVLYHRGNLKAVEQHKNMEAIQNHCSNIVSSRQQDTSETKECDVLTWYCTGNQYTKCEPSLKDQESC